jgi:hypothetical protein
MNSSFENQWRNALRNAEENPPIDVWRKIEGVLDLDNEFLIELAVKNKLLSGSEVPDASVWDNIEKALDQERKPIFILWFNKYAAAGIAALLFMALSFSIFNEKLNTIDLEEAQNTKPIEQAQSGDQAISGNSIINPTNVIGIISKDPSKNISQATNTLKALIAEDLLSEEASNFISENSTSSDDENLELNLDNKEFSILDLLIKKGFDAFGNSIVLNRKKLSYETPENLLADNSNFLQRSWFGLISGISPFDPNFKINNFERAALVGNNNFPRSSFEFNSLGDTGTDPSKSQTFAFPLSQPYNDVKAGNSINVGFNYGRRIKRNFSIESGIRYMAGKSLIATNVYSYNHRTGNVSTFLESNYLSKGTTVFDNTVISSGGDIDNDYTFLMVPLQLGYHVPLTDKLEAAFLAGISGDIIINNVFDNISEGGSKLTSANSAYKTINLSGMGGMKVNYLVRENWQLSIGTNVQQTLTSGIEKTEGFSFKPRYLGLNYGVNYRFN